MELFKLLGTIAVDNSSADKSIEQTTGKVGSLSKKFKSGIKTAAKWGVGIAAGATAGATAIYAFATKSASAADNIDKMSQKIGISRKAYQELDFICSQSGMSVDTLQAGMKSLTSAMDGAKSGTKSNVEQFERLGVAVTNADGTFRSQEDVMWDTLTALQGMGDQTEKARLATELFGRSGTELMPLLNGQAGSIEEMKNQAHDLGLVLDDETIDAGVKMTDTMDQLKRSFGTVVTKLGGKLMPVIQKFASYIIQKMPAIQSAIDKVKPVINTVFTFISDFIKESAPKVKTFIQDVINKITEISQQIAPVLIPIIETIIGYLSSFAEEVAPLISDAISGLIDFITGILTGLVDIATWLSDHETTATVIAVAIGTITTAIVAYKVATNAATIATKASTIATNAATIATKAFGTVMAFLTSPITLVVAAIGALIAIGIVLVKNWDSIKKAAKKLWEGIKNIFEPVAEWFGKIFANAWEKIKNAWNGVSNFFGGIWKGIKGAFGSVTSWFKDTFSAAWQAVKNVFSAGGKIFDGIKQGISNVFKTVVNALIGGINKVIAFPFNKINGMLNKIRSVKIPVIDVKPFKGLWGENPLPIPEIPKLAKGGIVDGSRLVEVGEDGKEAIMPLEKNTEWIDKLALRINSGNRVEKKLDELIKVIKSLKIYLDSGVMVGELTPAIDARLGQIYVGKERGR